MAKWHKFKPNKSIDPPLSHQETITHYVELHVKCKNPLSALSLNDRYNYSHSQKDTTCSTFLPLTFPTTIPFHTTTRFCQKEEAKFCLLIRCNSFPIPIPIPIPRRFYRGGF